METLWAAGRILTPKRPIPAGLYWLGLVTGAAVWAGAESGAVDWSVFCGVLS